MSIGDWVTFLHVNWFLKKLLVSVYIGYLLRSFVNVHFIW